jgi:hypothetical protein
MTTMIAPQAPQPSSSERPGSSAGSGTSTPSPRLSGPPVRQRQIAACQDRCAHARVADLSPGTNARTAWYASCAEPEGVAHVDALAQNLVALVDAVAGLRQVQAHAAQAAAARKAAEQLHAAFTRARGRIPHPGQAGPRQAGPHTAAGRAQPTSRCRWRLCWLRRQPGRTLPAPNPDRGSCSRRPGQGPLADSRSRNVAGNVLCS